MYTYLRPSASQQFILKHKEHLLRFGGQVTGETGKDGPGSSGVIGKMGLHSPEDLHFTATSPTREAGEGITFASIIDPGVAMGY